MITVADVDAAARPRDRDRRRRRHRRWSRRASTTPAAGSELCWLDRGRRPVAPDRRAGRRSGSRRRRPSTASGCATSARPTAGSTTPRSEQLLSGPHVGRGGRGGGPSGGSSARTSAHGPGGAAAARRQRRPGGAGADARPDASSRPACQLALDASSAGPRRSSSRPGGTIDDVLVRSGREPWRGSGVSIEIGAGNAGEPSCLHASWRQAAQALLLRSGDGGDLAGDPLRGPRGPAPARRDPDRRPRPHTGTSCASPAWRRLGQPVSDLDLLERYLATMSLRQTAQQVHLHHTTVQYRLKRIEQRARRRPAGSGGTPADPDRDPAVPDRAGRAATAPERAGACGEPRRASVRGRHADGTRLATDLYLPAGRGGSRPSWHGRRTAQRGNPVWFPAIGRLFADNGMAFVAQDTRGHHGSGGALRRSRTRRRTATTRASGSSASPGPTGPSPYSASPTSVSRPSPRRPAGIRRSARQPCAPPPPTSRATGSATRASSASSSSCDGRSRPGPAGTTLPPSSIGRSVRLRCRGAPLSSRIGFPPILDDWARDGGHTRHVARWPALIDRAPGADALHGRVVGPLRQRGQLRDWSHHARRGTQRADSSWKRPTTPGHDWGDGPTPDPLADFDALADRMPDVLGNELAFLRSTCSKGPTARRRPAGLVDADACRSTGVPDVAAAGRARRFVSTSWTAGRAHRGPEGGPSRRGRTASPWRRVGGTIRDSSCQALEGEALEGWFRRPDERLTQVREDVLTFTSDACARTARPRRARHGRPRPSGIGRRRPRHGQAVRRLTHGGGVSDRGWREPDRRGRDVDDDVDSDRPAIGSDRATAFVSRSRRAPSRDTSGSRAQ